MFNYFCFVFCLFVFLWGDAMLKRSDGKCLLTKEIYEKARKGHEIPDGVEFYDGESHLFILAFVRGRIGYFLSMGIVLDSLGCSFMGYVSEHPIEDVRARGIPSDQPLPSEKAAASTTTPLEE